MKNIVGILLLSLLPVVSFAANTQLTITTNLGAIEIELNDEESPITVQNFLAYTDSQFFQQTIFHRVIKNFVLQGGGYDQNLNEKPTLDPIINESKNKLSNVRGTLAMARTSDPDSATSQFYINLKDNLHLDYKDETRNGYAVFGRVIAGLEVIDKISEVSTHTVGEFENVPVEPVIILQVTRK